MTTPLKNLYLDIVTAIEIKQDMMKGYFISEKNS